MSDPAAITATLNAYQDALNGGNSSAATSLYTADGVVMPQHMPSSVGAAAIRKQYDGFFAALEFNVKFTIVEIRIIAPQWAFAQTTSAGTTTTTAGISQEANHELFVMQKTDGEWKIARYCFSTTNPPK